MNRMNFAHCSGVIVDVCKPHGTFFDRDELRRIVEFIRSGGLDKARALELANLKAEHERLINAPTAAIPNALSMSVDDPNVNERSSPPSQRACSPCSSNRQSPGTSPTAEFLRAASFLEVF